MKKRIMMLITIAVVSSLAACKAIVNPETKESQVSIEITADEIIELYRIITSGMPKMADERADDVLIVKLGNKIFHIKK